MQTFDVSVRASLDPKMEAEIKQLRREQEDALRELEQARREMEKEIEAELEDGEPIKPQACDRPSRPRQESR